MRLNRLEIRSAFKNLEGLVVNFDDNEDVTVVIGRNGAAKSNLLEALITIFRDVDLDEESAFAYHLKYSIGREEVDLTCDVDSKPVAKLAGKRIARQKLRDTYTPRFLVGYYSGESDRFEELFHHHDRLALKETLADRASTDVPQRLDFRRFIYARPQHGLFSLLAFYFSSDQVIQEFLKAQPRIRGFDSVILVAHKPIWAKAGANCEDFWGAKGPVRDLLERFRHHSLAPFSTKVQVKLDFRRKEERELVFLYLPDLAAVEALSKEYSNDPTALFQALDTMRLSDLLEDFRVRVNVVGANNAIHTRELSEGEQQLLTVLGLMRFTKNDNSLYLLDEPDTHLNPAWSVNYLEYLGELAGLFENSHTLIATHDPLLVSGLRKEQIQVLYRNLDGRVIAREPEEDPQGTGVANVLTSPLYGLESQLDPFSLKVLKEIYELSQQPDSEERNNRISELRSQVPALEILESSPDPYRNIAMRAYKLSLEMAASSGAEATKRSQMIEALAKMLFDEAKEVAGDPN